MNDRIITRRKFLGATASVSALLARPMIARADAKEVLIAEPVHGTGYLPLYIGIAKNLFDDVTVKIVTIETGSGHTNAVLSGQAFAFIGGPEHCAFAKAKGAELRAVVHCVDRGNVYFCAAKGLAPEGRDFAGFFKGKTIATSGFGGTPNTSSDLDDSSVALEAPWSAFSPFSPVVGWTGVPSSAAFFFRFAANWTSW